ncbi:MAG: hypothetical protein ACKN9U_12565, partial [Pirellulaceae bacterium]
REERAGRAFFFSSLHRGPCCAKGRYLSPSPLLRSSSATLPEGIVSMKKVPDTFVAYTLHPPSGRVAEEERRSGEGDK